MWPATITARKYFTFVKGRGQLARRRKRARMAEDDQATASGFLSPRRLEAIHISFNRVFDAAVKDGIIRDSATYRSFDHIIALSRTLKSDAIDAADERDATVPQNRAVVVVPTSLNPQPVREAPRTVTRIEVRIKPSSSSNLISPLTPPKQPSRRSETIEKSPLPGPSPLKLRSSSHHPRPGLAPIETQGKKHASPIRYRRAAEEIDRRYKCNYPGCNKGYGLLHHLNTHREATKHGRKMKFEGMCDAGTCMT